MFHATVCEPAREKRERERERERERAPRITWDCTAVDSLSELNMNLGEDTLEIHRSQPCQGRSIDTCRSTMGEKPSGFIASSTLHCSIETVAVLAG